jgi:hypothetical protein
MKHRTQAGRLKLQHHLIQGLRPVLEQMAAWPEVTSIVPGRIKRARSRHAALEIRPGVDTATGLKCIAKARDGGVQEVFVVTAEPARVRERLAHALSAR